MANRNEINAVDAILEEVTKPEPTRVTERRDCWDEYILRVVPKLREVGSTQQQIQRDVEIFERLLFSDKPEEVEVAELLAKTDLS